MVLVFVPIEEEVARVLVVHLVLPEAVVFELALSSCVALVHVASDLVGRVEAVVPVVQVVLVLVPVGHLVVVARVVLAQPPLLVVLVRVLPFVSVVRPSSDRGPMERVVASRAIPLDSAETVVAF